jgi:hypothetical protein
MVNIETLSIVFTGLSISLAAFYYISTLRNAQKAQKLQIETRQAQLFMPIYSTSYSEEHIKALEEVRQWEWEDYDDYMAKYGSEANPEAYMMYRKLFGYLEGLGVLVRRGLIDPSLVDDLMSGFIIRFWEKFEPYFVERRRRLNWPQVGEQIEYLYSQVRPIAERQIRELTTP